MASEYRMPGLRLRRAFFWGLVLATAGGGSALMLDTVSAGGVTALELLILALFAPTFAWIAIPFWTAVVGFALVALRRHPVTLASARGAGGGDDSMAPSTAEGPLPVAGTALVMPIFHEDPDDVLRRLDGVARTLASTGRSAAFHLHILSDTRDPEIGRREEVMAAHLQAAHPELAVFYRRRAENVGRKAGNLAEFCGRCGDDYRYMVVLDADSVMAGGTLVEMVRRMEANPRLALLQTVPLPTGQETLFGRLVQFAARVHAPLLAAGLAFWQGDTANYWGHNAIIRLAPFATHARLPVLSGAPPLGGEILSHDFVEAALLRRAGWQVILDPTLGGSWEEVPATLPEFGRRDRRWAQGSLQHLRLLGLPGLHWMSRLHLALGAMGYLSSVLWLGTLLAGTAYVLLPGPGAALMSGASVPLRLPGGVSLLALTAAMLFLPKLLAVVVAAARGSARWGGLGRLVASSILETGLSILLAPLLMLEHTRYVAQIALGRDAGWHPQVRRGRTLPWSDAVRAGTTATTVGVVWTGLTLAVAPTFAVWMSPIFAGLLLAIPVLRWTGSPTLGRGLARGGLLSTPEQRHTVPELAPAAGIGDPRPGNGVLPEPSHGGGVPSRTRMKTMVNAERGLFDLQRGRPLLIRSGPAPDDGTGPGAGHPLWTRDALVLAVEGLDDSSLGRLRELAPGTARLVVTRHRADRLGLLQGSADADTRAWAVTLDAGLEAEDVRALAAARADLVERRVPSADRATPAEGAGLALAHLARLLPAVVAVPLERGAPSQLDAALDSGEVLEAAAGEIREFVDSARARVVRISEAPVPLSEAEASRFTLFRETFGLAEHVAIQVGDPADWPDPVPVRLHSACLTGDLFGSLRCDCGEQLRGSMSLFAARGGGVLLYLAQEGRGIGLGNKFRAYSLQETGLDTIDADSTLGFGADERRYDVAVQILRELGIRRVELLTNNPEKMQALEEAGIEVAHRRPLHGRLNRHNRPYVEAKVNRAGHWLHGMLSQSLAGD